MGEELMWLCNRHIQDARLNVIDPMSKSVLNLETYFWNRLYISNIKSSTLIKNVCHSNNSCAKYGKLQQALEIITYLYQLQLYQIFLEDIYPLHNYIFLEYMISKMKCLYLLTVSIKWVSNSIICYSTLILYRKLLAFLIHNFFRTQLFVALKSLCSISCFVARSTSIPF